VRIRVGAEITGRGPARNVVASVAVPLDCPEQQVKIISEDISGDVGTVDYRPVSGGEVKQMVITIPRLASGQTATATVDFEVTTRPILPPEKTDDLVIPKRPPRPVRQFLGGSPYIETKHQKIRALSKEILKDVDESATDWERVEALYDAVLEKVKYVEGPDKGAIDSLRDEQADCQGRSMLFIALCRANKIPARMVWVDGHAYPEFYLEDADGKGYWFPCESAGTRAFGEMPLPRTILQKGDNFRMPERPKERLRYASDYMIGVPVGAGKKPKVKFIRQPLAE
jgi:transglutaminase-like putative cysteine protease